MRKILIESNMLNQTDNVISCDLEDLFVGKGGVFAENYVTYSIVLSHE